MHTLHLATFGFNFLILPTITIRYPIVNLFFIMSRFEKEGKLCQSFQTFLYILKFRVCSTFVTERKITILNPIGFCVIFEKKFYLSIFGMKEVNIVLHIT